MFYTKEAGNHIFVMSGNGVSFLACEKLNQYYAWPGSDWWPAGKGPVSGYSEEYPYDAATGEIIPVDAPGIGTNVKRIPCRLKQPDVPGEIIDLLREIERDITSLQEISMRMFGTSDNDSPMWASIERLLDREVCIAMDYHITPDQFLAIVAK